MIKQAEIRKISEREKVTTPVIDKDWILGHLLAGIYSDDTLSGMLIFKGGTCLRKCYYSDYRFSEDLDFTLITPTFEITKEHIEKILEKITSQQEISFYLKDFKSIKSKDKETGWDADIRYWGANHKMNEQPPYRDTWVDKIKLEMRHYELIVNNPVEKLLMHEYSDKHLITDVKVLCYSIEEILAEKFRSLLQRRYQAPRDYYDIWFLAKNEKQIDWNTIKDTFYKKSKFKSINPSEIKNILSTNEVNKICKEWQRTLEVQLPGEKMPVCEEVINEIKTLISELF